MAQNLEFMGTWDPSTGVFPVVPHDIPAAYYLVTGPGTVGAHSFTEGDWLLYIEETDTPTGSGTWYRTSGGIIQLATDTANNPVSITASDIEDFGEAVTAAILVDGSTIIKDENNQLRVIQTGSTIIDDDDDDPGYVAPHTHVSTDVTDWLPSVRTALGPGKLNKPFFSNTAISNAVVFTYDKLLATVSADVKIDNQTIVKNKYGQLVASKVAPMNIADILGLETYLDNYIASSNIGTAENQALSAESPSNGAWTPVGLHNFAGVKIGDALYLLNTAALSLRADLTELENRFNQSTAATAPAALNTSIIPVLDPSVIFHESLKAGTGEVIGVTLDRTPGTLPTAKFYKGGLFNMDLSGSILRAIIDDTVTGEIQLESSRDQSGDSASGALSIVEDVDSYADLPSFHNLFRSIRARISPANNLSAGRHTYKLLQILPGTGTFRSGELSVDIDVPAPPSYISIKSTAGFTQTPPRYYISGVPSLNPLHEYTFNPITAERVVGYTYGRYIVRVTGKDTLIDHEGDLPAASVPAAPATGQYGDASTAPFSFHIMDEYNESAIVSLTPFNSVGEAGQPLDILLGRIDNTFETNRVGSGTPTALYPSDHGAPWNASNSLVAAPYLGELQKFRKVYRWPDGDFTSVIGPNYTAAPGVSISGIPGTWRWATLKLAENVVGKVAFTLTLSGGNTAEWAANAFTKVTDGIMIYAKLGSSGWVDCNKPYRGLGVADINGAAAMDVGGHGGVLTGAARKRVTLGPSLATSTPGILYVRIALPANSTKQFADVSVSEWA